MQLKIADYLIHDKSPVFVVAELSANHNQDLVLAKKTLEAMKNAGADAVKIQTFTPDSMTLDSNLPHFMARKGTLWEGRQLYDLYRDCQTPREWHPLLQEQARQLGLVFFSSPFDKDAVDYLDGLNVPAFKVASPEITDLPLIEHIAGKGKPVILSSGIATRYDLEAAIKVINKTGNDQIAILKCTTAYPAPYSEINLRTIPDLRDSLQVIPGLSDHSQGIAIPIAAVTLGARIIEKHFILDRSRGGPDATFSLEPHEFKAMVETIRIVEDALGEINYDLTETTKRSRMAARSLFAVADISTGEQISEKNIRSLRPGIGLHPRYYCELIGRKARQDISYGTPLSWDLIEKD